MIDIFAGLYNKVMTFFQGEKGENTKELASNRLKLVLMHDRTKLDPLTIEKMRSELIDVISKYVVIDKELLELNLAGEGNSIALMLNIPVVRAKTEEELAELKAQEEAALKNQEEEDAADEIVDEVVDESDETEETELESEPEETVNDEDSETEESDIEENPEVIEDLDESVVKEETAKEKQ